MHTTTEPAAAPRNLRSHFSHFKFQVAQFRSHLPFHKPTSKVRDPKARPAPDIRPHLADGTIINQRDRDQLYSAITFSHNSPAHLRALMHYLASATPIPPPHVPSDLVTMNSVVVLRPLTAAAAAHVEGPTPVELVYPWDANKKPLARSITAPLGATLLGRRIGQTITWPTPDGPAEAAIEALRYQPEREGDFDR